MYLIMEALLGKIRKFNIWDGDLLEVGFIRKSYINNIFQYFGNKLVKVVVGQRRVGKSYLLRQIMMQLIKNYSVNPKNIFYLNKEYLVFDQIRTYKDLELLYSYYIEKISVKGKKYIFIDEIQNISGWERFINSYSQDFKDEFEICITGSNSDLLSGELASLLSGRFIEFEVFAFDYFEYSEFKKLKINKNNFIKYLKDSGLPELLHFESEEMKRNYLDSLKNTIVLRDIIKRHKVKDAALLNDLFNYLLSNIGNLSSISAIIRYYKSQQKRTNYETLSSYISYLITTFVFHTAERYNIRGKTLLSGEKKYYLNDLGFKNYLLGFYPEDIGYNLENFVFLQLKILGYKVNVGVMNKNEIDFVAQKGSDLVYVQVAYLLNSEKVIEREFGNLLKIKDNLMKVVVSLDEARFDTKQGIIHIRPWEMKELLVSKF